MGTLVLSSPDDRLTLGEDQLSITDRQRTELHRAAEEAMGREPADSLMALLPPVGWADVATKHDVTELDRRIDLRFEALEHRLGARFERPCVPTSSAC